MKRIIFTFLWILAFFIAGNVLFGVFSYITAGTFHPEGQESLDYWKGVLLMVVCWSAIIGLPILALILGVRGKLPGTRRAKNLAQP